MQLTAACACGALRVDLKQVSEERHMCCCVECQRRSGAPAGVSWYYEKEEVVGISGDYGSFLRTGTKGTQYSFNYCTACGTTVFWTMKGTDDIGVAAGCIPPDRHIAPQDVVWVRSKPDWFMPPKDIPWYDKGTSSEVVYRPE